MWSATQGSVTVTVTMPDYSELFDRAWQTQDPTTTLVALLSQQNYSTVTVDGVASVTVENGEQIVHSDELVKELMEKELIKVINTAALEVNE